MLLDRARSVRYKMLLVVIATTATALLIAGAAMVIYDLHSYQEAWVTDMVTQADILGRAGAPALAFDDRKTAQESLSLLKARPKISAAAIYTAKGTVFASFAQNDAAAAALPALPEADGYRIEGKDLIVFRRIVDNGEILGTVYLRARYELIERLQSYLGILSLVIAVSLVAAFALSYWLSSVVTKPILAINDVARRIMDSRDFSLRAAKTTADEIGSLVDGFNGMLAEIGRRAQELEASNRNLEQEMEERRAVEAALRERDARLYRAQLLAGLAHVITAQDGSFESWSETLPQLIGLDAADLPKNTRAWLELVHPDDREMFRANSIGTASSGDRSEFAYRLRHADGRWLHMRQVIEPAERKNGGREVVRWFSTIQDITAAKQTADDLRESEQRYREVEIEALEARTAQQIAETKAVHADELERKNKELEAFSYSVSHDLRAPLRAVVGFANLLAEEHSSQLDEEARRKLNIVRSEGERMSVLIDDLLAFSRLGRQAIQPKDLDMKALAKGMYDRLSAQNGGTKAEFQLGSLPHAKADRALLEQVWANFLSNALKFSAKRERPVIEVGAVSDGTEHIYFVRDNGAGFDPRYQSKLFGVFQRLHDTAEFAGTGVGLALVQQIINRHGGRVWAEGKPDAGATFYFTLPMEQRHGTS
jgi:PAS domain S-box-containing protein